MALLDEKYFAAAFTVKIKGKDLVKDQHISVTSVKIDMKIGQADNFSFTVQDVLADGRYKWLGNDLFKKGNEVTVELGYTSSTTVQTVAHIEDVAPEFSNAVTPTFTVSGKHKGYMKLTMNSGLDTYTKKKDSEIVSAIANEVGLSPTVDSTSIKWEVKNKKADTSNLKFIEDMVTENKEFEFFVANGTLYFRKAKTKQGAALTLEWGKHITSFKHKLDVSKIITGVTVKWWDQVKQEAIEGVASVSDETAVGNGSKTAGKVAQTLYGSKEKVISNIIAPSNADAKSIAQAKMQNNNQMFVTADVKTPGLAELVPGIMVDIKGLGDVYSGTYYVFGASHSIDGSGYQTSFSLRRNTHNGD